MAFKEVSGSIPLISTKKKSRKHLLNSDKELNRLSTVS